MTNFDFEKAKREQNYILEKTEAIYKMLQDEVVNYYWDRAPQDKYENTNNLEAIRRFLKTADDEIEILLTDLDRKLD